MPEERSKNILKFYLKANKNKEKTIGGTEVIRPYSIAEDTVMSCINALLLDEENASSKIRYYLLSSLEDKMIDLKKELDYWNYLGYSFENQRPLRYEKPSKENYASRKVYKNYLTLRNKIRQGHIYWGAKGDRLESILEHIYGCLVLTLGIESEYDYKVNFDRVMKMLLLHETEEIKIGDLTEWDISKEEKEVKGKMAVNELLSELEGKEELLSLIDEFNDKKTIESSYANLIDKLEYDMQVKVYELEGRYDFEHYPDNVVTRSKRVQDIINNGAGSVFNVHYEYDKERYYPIPCMRRILEETKATKKM